MRKNSYELKGLPYDILNARKNSLRSAPPLTEGRRVQSPTVFRTNQEVCIMSEKLFLIIAGGCCSVLSIAPMFVELPFFVMLVLATLPIVAVVPLVAKNKKK